MHVIKINFEQNLQISRWFCTNSVFCPRNNLVACPLRRAGRVAPRIAVKSIETQKFVGRLSTTERVVNHKLLSTTANRSNSAIHIPSGLITFSLKRSDSNPHFLSTEYRIFKFKVSPFRKSTLFVTLTKSINQVYSHYRPKRKSIRSTVTHPTNRLNTARQHTVLSILIKHTSDCKKIEEPYNIHYHSRIKYKHSLDLRSAVLQYSS